MNWDDLRIFVALARYGSLSAAARALSLNHATISRRISALEDSTGEKLVERRPDGYALTSRGRHVLALASVMESSAGAIARGHANEDVRGLVRLNAPPTLAQTVFTPWLATLAAKHEGLDIEVAWAFRNVSLDRREADIALRFGRPTDGDLMARQVATVGFGFYAASEWCRRIRNGRAPEFVGFDESNASLPEARWLSRHFPRARMAFRAGGQVAQAAAAARGTGIALLPHLLGRSHRGLQRCVLEDAPPSRSLWMVTRRMDRHDSTIEVVTRFLLDRFVRERTAFEEGPPVPVKKRTSSASRARAE